VKNAVFVALGQRLMFISYPMRLKLHCCFSIQWD
jgi:hypothetical protein